MQTLSAFRFIVVLVMLTLGGRIASPQAAQAQSTPVPLTFIGDQAAKFQQIHMIDAVNGWAVVGIPHPNPDAQSGQIYTGTFAHILRTTDGGQTWVDVSPSSPFGDYNVMHYLPCDCADNGLLNFVFLDDQHAYIANDHYGIPGNQIYNGISVWATSDGGTSWQLSDVLDAVTVLEMSFVDPDHGWLMLGGLPTTTYYLEAPSSLYQTVDGGLHWAMIADDGVNPHYNPQRDPISSPETGIIDAKHTGMVFDSPESGWITWTAFDPSYGSLRHSTDGGVTWHNVEMPDDPHLPGQYNGCLLTSPQTFADGASDAVTFAALCWNYDDHVRENWLYRSDDAGETWHSTELPSLMIDVGALASMPQIIQLDAETAWVGECEPPADDLSACEPSFDDPSADAAPADVSYHLLQTRDGGVTWTALAPLPADFYPIVGQDGVPRLSFIDADHGWAVTNAGGLMTTSDGGATWEPLTPELTMNS